MAKDVNEVTELTNYSPEKVRKLYDKFTSEFARGVLHKRWILENLIFINLQFPFIQRFYEKLSQRL